ncbi:hypothetical protein [Diaphorobacter caeni]|uniref:hypothetical protein n=1 Tax=Diaphorobacter caeni TaxID=2784387 RepID=UPI0018907C28|nr:hypothetical protein [Diaphorobacter caeni]MBF5006853.1 hypothetical protein [Diaphorobacter caeni]
MADQSDAVQQLLELNRSSVPKKASADPRSGATAAMSSIPDRINAAIYPASLGAVRDVANRAAINVMGAPVDAAAVLTNSAIAAGGLAGHKLGLMSAPPDLIQSPVGGSEWLGQKFENMGSVSPVRRPAAEALATLMTPLAGLGRAAATGPKTGFSTDTQTIFSKPAQGAGGVANSGDAATRMQAFDLVKTSKNAIISDPKPLQQRPFHDDYPQGAQGERGSPLTVDIDGNPLGARFIAGRRTVGGDDEGLSGVDAYGLARDLGIQTDFAARSGPQLKGDFGRYTRSGDQRTISIDHALPAETQARVQRHELGHAVDDLTFATIGRGGSKIPTDGIKRELSQVYSDQNSSMYVPKGKIGATPKTDGYPPSEIDSELMSEAIRAYMADPNYIKSVAPKTAKRIREYVNSNPNLNKVIQFNSAGAGLGLGAAATLMHLPSDDASSP